MTTLVCFSGQIGSGKSSVSTVVATALGWRRTGFGDYLRAEITRAGGDPHSREGLQHLGQRLLESDPEAFCRSVMAAGGFTPGDDFLVDGVRHVEIFRILARIAAPSTARLLFLEAGEAHRLARVSDRADKDDFARAAMHLVEAELRNDLPAISDAVIDATRPFKDVVADCVAIVRIWQQS
jgi:dephospho-CoA kinase